MLPRLAPVLTLLLAAGWSFGQAPAGVKSRALSAPKGLPTPRMRDGKPDLSGVYHAPGYSPGDPRSKAGEGTPTTSRVT
jgi:hypothetical protein